MFAEFELIESNLIKSVFSAQLQICLLWLYGPTQSHVRARNAGSVSACSLVTTQVREAEVVFVCVMCVCVAPECVRQLVCRARCSEEAMGQGGRIPSPPSACLPPKKKVWIYSSKSGSQS